MGSSASKEMCGAEDELLESLRKKYVARRKAETWKLKADRLRCTFLRAQQDAVDARRRWSEQPENPATRASLKKKLRKEEVARRNALVCKLEAERLANTARKAERKVVATQQKLRN